MNRTETDKKKDQIHNLMETAERKGETIDWATIVLC